MFFVYVLQNQLTGKHYTGQTEHLEQRVHQHNHGITKSTKNRGEWKLVYCEEFATRAKAMQREKFLKTEQGREQLPTLIAQGRP